MKKVILNLGNGTLLKGCETVIGEILGSEGYPLRFVGQLPAAIALADTQARWSQLYAARNQDQALRIHLVDDVGVRYSASDFQQVCVDLERQLNEWLSAPEFLGIDRVLRTELKRDENIQIILETTNLPLMKLPWHLWQLFEAYPKAELTFSHCEWRPLPDIKTNRQRPRVLATLGNSDGIDLSADLTALDQLSGENASGLTVSNASAERTADGLADSGLTVLRSPTLNQLHEALWQPEGWDLFFFAGHSQTEGKTGVIDLNDSQRLSIAQLKHALGKAIANGLKIAVFNSCDGLGLAQQIAELQIPYVVVMREPVPDAVAQQFLGHLLSAFVQQRLPFHLAVREARQRLAGLEDEILCASWLPVIWQNPTAPAVYWQALSDTLPSSAKVAGKTQKQSWRSRLLQSALVGGAIMGVRALSLLSSVELAAYDHLMRQRPTESIDSRIVMVEISEETTSEYGYPLPDDSLTAVIDKISAAQPLAIGLDLHRAKPNPAGAKPDGEKSDGAKPDGDNVAFESTAIGTRPTSVTEPLSPGGAEQSGTGYARFLEQVEAMPNLFLVCVYGSSDKNYRTPPQLSETAKVNQVGFSDLPTDGVSPWLGGSRNDLPARNSTARMGAMARRQLLSYHPELTQAPSSCTTPYSFSFQLAYQYLYDFGVTPLEVTADEHWRFGSVTLPSMAQRFGAYQNLEGPTSQLMINYRANQPGQKLTLEQILSDNFDPQVIQDRVVIVGYTAPVSKDYFDTPYGAMAGMWVHAHMTSQLIARVLDDRPLIRTLPQWRSWQWGDAVWVLAWAGVGAWVGAVKKHRWRWLLDLSLSGIGLYGVCWAGLILGFWLPLVPGAIALSGTAVLSRLSGSDRSSTSRGSGQQKG